MTPSTQITCTSCKLPFTPIVTASGFHFSKLCRTCLVEKETAKRRDLLSKREVAVIKPKTAKKGREVDLLSKSLPALLELATEHFNLFIRNRDRLEGNRFHCPTCNKTKRIEVIDGKSNYQACHCFPAGFYPELRFNENNVFGGCLACNFYRHGSSYTYNEWVRERIGEEEYQKLKDLTSYRERNGWKWDRFSVMEIIKKYKKLNKEYKLNTINQ
ncbi:MAG: recombination protein NinG [Verrucomicrobiota bacterium]